VNGPRAADYFFPSPRPNGQTRGVFTDLKVDRGGVAQGFVFQGRSAGALVAMGDGRARRGALAAGRESGAKVICPGAQPWNRGTGPRGGEWKKHNNSAGAGAKARRGARSLFVGIVTARGPGRGGTGPSTRRIHRWGGRRWRMCGNPNPFGRARGFEKNRACAANPGPGAAAPPRESAFNRRGHRAARQTQILSS